MTYAPFNTPLLRCQRVTKHFGQGENRIEALHDVNLEVSAGELTLLVGPSGCGKTTMISLMAGLLNPTAGQIEFRGTDLTQLSQDHKTLFRRRNIGFIFQQYQLLPAFTAVENAAVPLIVAGVPQRKAIRQATDILERLGMGHRVRSLPTQLSYGQQQRVAIARALIHEPGLLLCDEPTAALDAQTGRTVMELISEVAVQPDRAVIVVTHDNRVFDFGDRVVEMNDGRIVGQRLHETATCEGGAE